VSRFAAAAAFACTIVLISDPSHARAGLRGFKVFSSAPKAAVAKPLAGPAAAPARSSNSVFIAVGGRPAATAGAPQQAVSDPASSLYQPVSAEAKAAPTDAEAPKELTAASSTECAVKEPAKETVAAQEPAKAEPPNTEPTKTEPTRSRSAFLVPVVNRHPQAPVPRRTVVCFVQRDGTCAP
jgi:hypothetical protein